MAYVADEELEVGGFSVLNLSAGLLGSDWSLDFFVSNVTNERELVSFHEFDFMITNAGLTIPEGVTFDENFVLPPRAFRVMLRKSF